MYKIFTAAFLYSALGAGFAIAQTTTSPSSVPPAAPTGSAVPMPSAPRTNSDNTTTAPVAGANSFTMAQAQKRIEDQGYTQVSGLVKDDNSIWRGHAMKNGKAVGVSVDYKGNVTAH
jgi:protein CpxP